MLALLVALSLSQVTPDSRVTRVERVPGGRMEGGRGGVKAWAFFEAFPLGGAGTTTTACSTTPPTGAKGEALTFSRTGNATCTKTASGGLATTGIADGDLVVMSANQPRVEYDSAGTLGLLVESARTNSLVRSESIDNAAWTKAAGATVTADYAIAPTGTMTADRLVYNATSSYVLGALSTGGLTYTTSVFLRGTSSSGSIDMCRGGGAGQCTVCSYVADSWTRCVWPHTYATASNFFIGCDIPTAGTCSPAGDVLVWGLQGEAGAYATSYIPTTSAAVTRNAESAYFARTFFSTAAGASMAVSTQAPTASPIFARYNVAGDGSSRLQLDAVGLSSYIGRYNVAFVGPAPSATGTARSSAASVRTAVAWDGTSTATLYAPGAAPTSGVSAQGSWTGGELWLVLPGAEIDGLISRVCLDPSPSRCR